MAKLNGKELVLAVDPGGVHVGVAEFWQEGNHWVCVQTFELTPEGFVDYFTTRLEELGSNCTVVVEVFRLYPDKAMAQVGSEVPTAELIGYVKHYLHYRRLPAPVMQPAAIKRPTEGLMRLHRLHHLAVLERKGGHAKDAETHGVHYLLRTREQSLKNSTDRRTRARD